MRLLKDCCSKPRNGRTAGLASETEGREGASAVKVDEERADWRGGAKVEWVERGGW